MPVCKCRRRGVRFSLLCRVVIDFLRTITLCRCHGVCALCCKRRTKDSERGAAISASDGAEDAGGGLIAALIYIQEYRRADGTCFVLHARCLDLRSAAPRDVSWRAASASWTTLRLAEVAQPFAGTRANSSSTFGRMSSTMRATPCALGWSPSSCMNLSSSATPSRKKG